ncbi:single-stranded DNA-binding protein [Coraliomargarita parva]|uniref:single-stranded DNA-binding protein n=1 Tax=Coraliomargarita parva TaxID=3014050 RepID=UPI0022B59D4C|nr:single-stranded DNA-binding protein [Coraliomargarita parva]
MNQTILSGRLTSDIETRNVGEQHLGKFTLACNEGDRVVFMPVECWNMPHLPKYLGKGSKVLVAGSLKQDQWETEKHEKRSRIVLAAFRVEFLSPMEKEPEPDSGRTASPTSRSGRRTRVA